MFMTAFMPTFVVVSVREDMHAEVYSKADKQSGRYVAYPFLHSMEFACERVDGYGTI